MKNLYKIVLVVFFSLAFFVWAQVAKSPAQNDVSIYFLDVGQGDAELIQKGNYQILIDGGPDDKVLSELGKVLPVTDHTIEEVILTHPHADHLVGLNEILDRYEIGHLIFSGVSYQTNQYLEFLSKVKEKVIKTDVPKIGDEINPFDGGSIKFLWPGEAFINKKIDNLNNSSIVSKFCFLQECVLFTGDIETDEQDKMIDYYEKNGQLGILQSNYLKVPHHGSSNGLSEKLLKLVMPSEAIISVGSDNNFGHPHKQTIDLLGKLDIKTDRTDRDGTIKIDLDP